MMTGATVAFNGAYRTWAIQPVHPFYYFLEHSDCNGYLIPSKCQKLIPAFRDLLGKALREQKEKIQGDPSSFWAYALERRAPDTTLGWNIRATKEWLRACEHSARDSCRLIFE